MANDAAPMRRALDLAARAIGLSDPNPRVGCVIVRDDGTVLGEGHTQRAGDAHAEVAALRAAASSGHDVRGATAYVTLEPCCHQGRTAPCCDALIDAGLAKVVIAIEDPNPLVAGQGAARLRAAGITVATASEEAADASRELNIGFFSRMIRGRPWVRMKIAASLDGRTALPDGRSQWITGEAARIDGHRWRKRAGAVLTGIGTVLADDPRLDVRLVETVLQPLRIVVDSRLALPPGARILAPPGSVLVYTASDDGNRATALRANGAEVVRVQHGGASVSLVQVLEDLAAREVNEVHVEAGARLNGAVLRQSLADELVVYLAPMLLGTGLDMASFGPLGSLADAVALRFVDVEPIGADIRLRARKVTSPSRSVASS